MDPNSTYPDHPCPPIPSVLALNNTVTPTTPSPPPMPTTTIITPLPLSSPSTTYEQDGCAGGSSGCWLQGRRDPSPLLIKMPCVNEL